MNQLHVPVRSLIDSAAFLEALHQKCIAGELTWAAGEIVLDVILSLDCDSPQEPAREEPFVGVGDGSGGGCSPTRDQHVLRLVKKLKAPPHGTSVRPGVREYKGEVLILGSGDQGGQELPSADVEDGYGHVASVGEERHSECRTEPTAHGTGLTLDDVQSCGVAVLRDIDAEADLARETMAGDFTTFVDHRTKWKRDAVNAYASRLRAAAKQN